MVSIVYFFIFVSDVKVRFGLVIRLKVENRKPNHCFSSVHAGYGSFPIIFGSVRFGSWFKQVHQ